MKNPNRPDVFIVDTSAFTPFLSPRRMRAFCLKGSFYYNLHGAFCAAVLKLDSEPEACSSLFDLSLLSSSQGLVPSGGPEIFRRNWIEIMWYVAFTAEGERGAEGLVWVAWLGGGDAI